MNRHFARSASIVIGLLIALGWSLSATAHPGCGCANCQSAGCAQVQSCLTYQTVERTVMVPEMTWEVRQVPITVCRPEVRQQRYTVMRPVYETRQVTRHYTVMETEQRVHVQRYTVATPTYRNVERQVTEMVPHQEIRQGVRQVCRPVQVQEMRNVCADRGHFEERQIQVGGCCDTCGSYCGRHARCGSCGGCATCGPTYTVCRVWVPNVVQEQVPVTVWRNQLFDEPYEYSVTVCRPVNRVVQEQVCEMKYDEQTREIPYTVCVPKPMTKVEDVKICREVPEEQLRDVTVMVSHTEMKEVQVPVCRVVPRVISCQVPVWTGCGGCGSCNSCCGK